MQVMNAAHTFMSCASKNCLKEAILRKKAEGGAAAMCEMRLAEEFRGFLSEATARKKAEGAEATNKPRENWTIANTMAVFQPKPRKSGASAT